MKTMDYKKEGKLGIVTLNRPDRMNVICNEFLDDLETLLNDLEKDGDLGALIITGEEKVFAAGADIKEIRSIEGVVAAHLFVTRVQHLFNRIEAIEVPVIAAVNGLALGGGCELSLVCDIRIAADTAVFGLPEIKLGVLPGAGGTQRLPRLVGAGRAKELLYTGDSIDAAEALRIGLVNRITEHGSLMETAQKMAGRLAVRPPVAIRLIKSAVNRGLNMDLQGALEYEARSFEMLFTTRSKRRDAGLCGEKETSV